MQSLSFVALLLTRFLLHRNNCNLLLQCTVRLEMKEKICVVFSRSEVISSMPEKPASLCAVSYSYAILRSILPHVALVPVLYGWIHRSDDLPK